MYYPEFIVKNVYILLLIIVLELVWKGIALWRAAGRKQKYWFIAILIVNSLGILPIIYLLISRGKKAVK